MNTSVYYNIKKYIQGIIKSTEFENNVFAVGGCVRDDIMGASIKDVDLVVSMENGGIRFAEWLRDNGYVAGTIVTYERFGTAMFKLKAFPAEELEAVQTRAETYPDESSRNPRTEYGSIKDDCIRRDLTINALYCNISTDKVIDVCGYGIEDIKNHIIRTPTAPDKTYTDDPLRILRCIRFASRFGKCWKIAPDVMESMKKNVGRLSIISKERINAEFIKILGYKDASYGMQLLNDINAFPYIIEGISQSDSINRMLDVLCSETQCTDVVPRLAYLLADKDEAFIKNALTTLKFSSEEIKGVCKYVNLYNECINDVNTEKDLMRLEYNCGHSTVFENVLDMVKVTNTEQYNKVLSLYEKTFNNGDEMFWYELPVNGDDIMRELNIRPGRQVKDCLDYLMDKAFEKPNRNDFIDLIRTIKL